MLQPTLLRTIAGLALLAVTAAVPAQGLISTATPEELVAQLTGGDQGRAGGVLKNKWAYIPTALPEEGTSRCQVSAQGKTGKLAVLPASDAVYLTDDTSPGKVDLDIRFREGTDQLDTSSLSLLANLARALNAPRLQGSLMAVAGHTDRKGDDTEAGRRRNLELSCARALAVRAYLIEQGVEGSRLAPYGFGSRRPLQEGVVDAPINRRVEIRRAS